MATRYSSASFRAHAALAVLFVIPALAGCGGGGGGGGGGDTTAPHLTARSPGVGAQNVAVDASVTATFNEPILAQSVTVTSFRLLDALSNPVPGTSVSVADKVLTLTPPVLAYDASYTVLLTTGITDLAGNALTQEITWGFTTVADTAAPSTPDNVIPTVVDHSEITLSWDAANDNVGVTGYRIYRDSQLLVTVQGVVAADSGLAPATEYCYEVAAIDAAGNESAKSTQSCASTHWRQETLIGAGPGLFLGARIDVALGPDDTLHASYQSANSRLAYAQRSSGSWGHDTVSQTDAVTGTAIAADTLNNAHIAYFEFTTKVLKYATNLGGGWAIATVDSSSADVGREPAIAVDTGGKAHIAYFDAAGGALKYATNASGGWVTTPVDSGGANTGREPAIAVDGTGTIHIAYKDTTVPQLSLKYATNPGGVWNSETVSRGRHVGGHVHRHRFPGHDSSGVSGRSTDSLQRQRR